MQIIDYSGANNIQINFPEYNWITKTTYRHFKSGEVKCPYEKRYYGKGYLGEGCYKMSKNGKLTKEYRLWYNMLIRCYNPNIHNKFPTYVNCEVCDEWLNFQNFATWYNNNYYTVQNEVMSLDKDILVKGNKLYSPETCIFVPQRINSIFIKSNSKRGNLPIGVSRCSNSNKFIASCHTIEKYQVVHIGMYDTIIDAFNAYKLFKENMIKQLADKYEKYIPKKLYEALYNYKVEIDD